MAKTAENPVWRYDAGQTHQSFTTRDMPKRQQFDAWADRLSHTYDIAQPYDTDGHLASSEVWSLGPIAVSEVDCAPQITRLKLGRARLTEQNALHLRLYTSGRSHGVIGGRSIETKAGEVHAFDMSRPFVNVTEGARFTGVFIPHRLVGYDPSRFGPHGMLQAADGTGRLLAASIKTLVGTRTDLGETETRATVEGFLALVRALCLGKMADAEDLRAVAAARSSELRAFIEENLTDPELSTAMVCRAFGASRATVYRDFAEDGGIRRYIQGRRLQLARDELARTRPARGAVGRIAERSGFTDQAQFTRAFRSAFGTSPGDVLGAETGDQ